MLYCGQFTLVFSPGYQLAAEKEQSDYGYFPLSRIFSEMIMSVHVILFESLLAKINIRPLDWLQSLKQFFINVSYHRHVASLTQMALF